MTQAAPEKDWTVILCGGRGSRLGEITERLPKPLVDVQGRPILWYLVEGLLRHSFRHFVLPLGYRGEMIRQYVEETFRGRDCEFHCIDTGTDTAIADRIAQVAPLIPAGADFFLTNSDTLFEFDIEEMYATHRREQALVTLASVEVVSSWGLVHLQGGRLVGFDRQRKIRYLASGDSPDIQGRVYSGFAFLNKDALSHIDLASCEDFESALFPTLIKAGRAAHFEIHGRWFPIDTPKDLAIVNLVGAASEDQHGVGNHARQLQQTLELNCSQQTPDARDSGDQA